jgi:hypothetical protein
MPRFSSSVKKTGGLKRQRPASVTTAALVSKKEQDLHAVVDIVALHKCGCWLNVLAGCHRWLALLLTCLECLKHNVNKFIQQKQILE